MESNQFPLITSQLHHHLCLQGGAGDENRTHISSLEDWLSTIELHPRIDSSKYYVYLYFDQTTHFQIFVSFITHYFFRMYLRFLVTRYSFHEITVMLFERTAFDCTLFFCVMSFPPRVMNYLIIWSGWQDLNLRPLRSKRSTLIKLSYTQKKWYLYTDLNCDHTIIGRALYHLSYRGMATLT